MTLRETFQTVSESAINAKLFRLQALILKHGEHILEYSNRLVDLIGKLEGAGHSVTMVEQKRTLLRGLLKEYEATVDAIMVMKHKYNQAVAKLVV